MQVCARPAFMHMLRRLGVSRRVPVQLPSRPGITGLSSVVHLDESGVVAAQVHVKHRVRAVQQLVPCTQPPHTLSKRHNRTATNSVVAHLHSPREALGRTVEREERATLHSDRVLPRAGGVLAPMRRRCAVARRMEGVVHDGDVDVALFATAVRVTAQADRCL